MACFWRNAFLPQTRVWGYDATWPAPVERDIIAEALRESQKRGVITRQEITKARNRLHGCKGCWRNGGSPLKRNEYATVAAFRRALRDRLAGR
jgi:hypothetical protein